MSGALLVKKISGVKGGCSPTRHLIALCKRLLAGVSRHITPNSQSGELGCTWVARAPRQHKLPDSDHGPCRALPLTYIRPFFAFFRVRVSFHSSFQLVQKTSQTVSNCCIPFLTLRFTSGLLDRESLFELPSTRPRVKLI